VRGDHPETGQAADDPRVVVVLEVELDGALHLLDVDIEVAQKSELPRELVSSTSSGSRKGSTRSTGRGFRATTSRTTR
jgi:hypothetical protein